MDAGQKGQEGQMGFAVAAAVPGQAGHLQLQKHGASYSSAVLPGAHQWPGQGLLAPILA